MRGWMADINDNAVQLFSRLMDAQSPFLTANADSAYFLSFKAAQASFKLPCQLFL
jgi:hypothetical protein